MMNHVDEVWSRLQQADNPPEVIVALLDHLSQLQLFDRVCCLATVQRFRGHPDESVRAAAVTALQGASGGPAISHIVRALDDASELVRNAAVQTLVESTPDRLIHVYFHRDVNVRKAAVAMAVPGTESLQLYLLSDPATRDTVIDQISSKPLQSREVPGLLDCLERGQITADQARRMLAPVSWPVCESTGRLQDVIALFWEAQAGSEFDQRTRQTPADTFFRNGLNWLLAADSSQRDRVAALLQPMICQRGLPKHAAGLVAVIYPLMLPSGSVPPDVRQAAITTLYQLGKLCPRHEENGIRPLLHSDWCCTPSGGVDLWAVGGFLHLVNSPYRRVQEWFGTRRIVRAFLKDMAQAAPFLFLPHDRSNDRDDLVRQIDQKRAGNVRLWRAIQVYLADSDYLMFLDRVESREMFAVLDNLLLLAQRHHLSLSIPKSQRVAQALRRKITSAQIGAFVMKGAQCTAPTAVELAMRVLQGVLPNGEDPASLAQALGSHPDERVRAWAGAHLNVQTVPVSKPATGPVSSQTITREQVQKSCDLDELEAYCLTDEQKLAEDAILRLMELGEPGYSRLVAVLQHARPARAADVLNLLSCWPDGAALEQLRILAADPHQFPSNVRFQLGLALVERGESSFLAQALDAISSQPAQAWFHLEHWQCLMKHGISQAELAIRLASSPQRDVVTRAMSHLFSMDCTAPRVQDALVAFLRFGATRRSPLGLAAIGKLDRQHRLMAFPSVVSSLGWAGKDVPADLLRHLPPQLVREVGVTALMGGPGLLSHQPLPKLLGSEGIDPDARDASLRDVLVHSPCEATKKAVVEVLKKSPARGQKLRVVAEVFAWGVMTAFKLTGEQFAIEMITGDELGWTRLTEPRLFINPLPMLLGGRVPHGRTIVEALILHELGHHLYHSSKEAQRVWEKAAKQGLQALLNLVADVHLERNLSSLGAKKGKDFADFGDKLKTLVAYAFQHSTKEVSVSKLLMLLKERSFGVLSKVSLRAARQPGYVQIESGALLKALEDAESSFVRFVRVLRMGLPNRWNDPKVDQALAVFKGKFRDATMSDLLECARRLAEIFGSDADFIDLFAQDQLLQPSPSELLGGTEGISASELQAEIRRILTAGGKTTLTSPEADPTAGRVWGLNGGSEEVFTPIAQVVRLAPDRDKQAAYAQRIAGPARQLRRRLETLGRGEELESRRLSGRRIDPGRLRSWALRADPRLLQAAEPCIQTNLFLGVLIDCSGSMAGKNIERARLFGSLVAEAARGCPGIDLRVWGFTDQVLYDAGSADYCAVHALQAGGSNNDAAALWHAAEVARRSGRTNKLLVMISDGLPTACTVVALRALVRRASRGLGICCAQVAVQPLKEECFPNHILLDETNLEESIRQFAAVITDLVGKALAS